MKTIMDFEEIQKQVQTRIAQIGELLDVSDQIAKGDRRANRDQMSALKLSIDSRIRLLGLWKPAETNMNITSPVRIIYERLADTNQEVPRVPVAGVSE